MSDFPIVVIGASAGGIAPVMSLLEPLPCDMHAALFVVVHTTLPRTLVDVRSKAGTGLPTHLARDLQRFERGHVYVCPADKNLSLENGVVRAEGNSPVRFVSSPVPAPESGPRVVWLQSTVDQIKAQNGDAVACEADVGTSIRCVPRSIGR